MQTRSLHSEFSDAMHLCWQVTALVKYGHFEDAVQEVRSANFLDSELKQVVCQWLTFERHFPAPLVLDPFIRKVCAQQG